MKVKASVRKMCDKCKIIKRAGCCELFVLTLSINKGKGNVCPIVRGCCTD